MTTYSPHSIERSATVRLGGMKFHIHYYITGVCYYDPGRLSGPPEDCYPPESEAEVQAIALLSLTNEWNVPVTHEMTRALILAELKKLPLEDYLLEDWMAEGAPDGRED